MRSHATFTASLQISPGSSPLNTYTQTVLALAEMSDDAVRSAAASILVTLGACVDEVWSE